jgi:hypothetical protein
MRDRFSIATLNVHYLFHRLRSERQARKIRDLTEPQREP